MDTHRFASPQDTYRTPFYHFYDNTPIPRIVHLSIYKFFFCSILSYLTFPPKRPLPSSPSSCLSLLMLLTDTIRRPLRPITAFHSYHRRILLPLPPCSLCAAVVCVLSCRLCHLAFASQPLSRSLNHLQLFTYFRLITNNVQVFLPFFSFRFFSHSQ